MSPHTSREYLKLRSWRDSSRLCQVFSCSVSHENATMVGDIRAACFSSIWTMESCGDSVQLSSEIRYDTKGRGPDWYDKMCPSQLANDLIRIRDTFLIDSMSD